MADLRPMRDDDVEAVTDLVYAASDDARPSDAVAHARYRYPLRHDADGAWVAEDEHGLAAVAIAFRREDLWMLTEISVRPDLQSAGLGRRMLARVHDYADGARGRLIASSRDPRALRAYARLGLDAHPCLAASGVPAGVTAPEGVRVGGPQDLDFAADVDRAVRGAAHGPDLAFLLDGDQTLLVSDRGYAVVGDSGGVRILAAYDEAGARELLRAALARAGERAVGVGWISARQPWALQECVAARLELRADAGVLFAGGDVGPFHPYLPSGAYL